MHTTTLLIAVPAALAAGFLAGRSTETAAPAPAATPPTATVVQDEDAMRSLLEPGDHHRLLDVFVGSWDAQIFSPDPSTGELVAMPGRMESDWIMGGRFLRQRVTVEMPTGTFEGLSLMGYSAAEKVYESVWIDNMVVDMAMGSGFVSPDGARFTMLSTEVDPATMATREVEERTRVLSKDEIAYERFYPEPDGDVLAMRVIYTRRPAAEGAGR